MHITVTKIRDAFYCYAAECKWNPGKQKGDNPSKAVGKLDGDGNYVPNKYFSELLMRKDKYPETISEHEQLIIDTVKDKYGEDVKPMVFAKSNAAEINKVIKTATIIRYGPQLVFKSITARYRIDYMLSKAFGDDLAQDILSMAWYITCEGSALSNNDSWLDYFENPRGSGFSSQEVSKFLDLVDYDGIMTFYKLWLKGFNKSDKVLYDLTSISYYGTGINAAERGFSRNDERLPQVNYALLCIRSTAMPLFAWPLNGSITDVSTLETTLQFLNKLGYNPNCLMMDRGFARKRNIVYMLQHKYTFLQALKVNAKWIWDIIDAGEIVRNRPDSQLKIEKRTYYASTTHLQLVHCRKSNRKGVVEELFFYHCEGKRDRYRAQDGEGIEVIEQYPCQAHVLFCQDLVGSSWDRFMENLNSEYARLLNDPSANVKSEYKAYFLIEKPKYARRRTVDFNMEAIAKYKNKYAGHICFLTNDPTIKTAEEALSEYSTRDYIEKDFDEMKNELDMERIRVHTDNRMRARLFVQFIAEIYLREVRFKLRNSEVCRKMTKTQIFSHLKTIEKVHFQGKYKDVVPELSKSQRSILEALEIQI
jgi:hypothetical protein